MTKELTSDQRDELIQQYVEIVVDNMSEKDLTCYAQEQLADYFDKLSDIELKEDIDINEEGLYDELVNNITSEEKCQTYQELLDSNTGGKH